MKRSMTLAKFWLAECTHVFYDDKSCFNENQTIGDGAV